jgi:hypothetical protein
MAGIGLLLLIVWGGLALYNYVRSDEGGLIDKDELDEAQKMYDAKTKEMLESELGPVIDEMAKEVLAKPKRKPKVAKSEYPLEPHAKTVKKSVTKKTK